jgi:hypothetical protein
MGGCKRRRGIALKPGASQRYRRRAPVLGRSES